MLNNLIQGDDIISSIRIKNRRIIMLYNFGELVDQVESSVKWGMTEKYFGAKDLIPMWVADMDFRGPQPVIDALKKRA
jgi:cysteine-S-conjugate beta-lyase